MLVVGAVGAFAWTQLLWCAAAGLVVIAISLVIPATRPEYCQRAATDEPFGMLPTVLAATFGTLSLPPPDQEC